MAPRSMDHPPQGSGPNASLGRTRGLTRVVMAAERLWPLVLPLLLVIGLYLAASWFGLFRIAPDFLRFVLAVLFGLGALAALFPLRFFRWPRRSEVDRRIETANQLQHAPVLTQSDQLTGQEDPFATALWREHQRRMADKLARLSSDLPNTGVPERDPFGARAAVALLVIIAFAFSVSPYGGRILDAFQARPGIAAVPPRVDAWVTPPAYTGRAPIFLTADVNLSQPVLTVPVGSDVAVRITGGSGGEELQFTNGAGLVEAINPLGAQDDSAEAAEPAPDSSLQFATKLAEDGVLSLVRDGAQLQQWAFLVTPDLPPVIRFTDEPKRASNGSLELAYSLEDDYGVASAQAVITPAEEPASGARPLYDAPEMPLALPRRGETERKTSRDLSEHPWAGREVDLALKAVDGAGQEGLADQKPMRLPERTFANPLARALIEQRRILAADANTKGAVLQLMDAITLRPEDTIQTNSHYLGIMSARTRLELAASDDQLREVVDYLWEIALTIEDGALSDAARRLRQAQQALKDALENGASDEEIEQRMAELRDAMNEFLREFAEQAQQNPDMAQQMPQDGQELRQSDLERMMDQIEDLAKSGQRDQAQELLSQLEQMMNNLQAGRQQQQQQGQGQQQDAMRQQMDQLGELMRRQQEMMNETFRLDQMQRGQQGEQGQGEQGQQGEGQQGQQGQGQQGQGQGGQGRPMTPQEFAEALQQLQEGQGQLQQELENLTDALRGMGIQPGEGFGQAGEAMGRAEGALGQSEGQRAVGEQGAALEALRRGAQDMMQQMQQAQQGQEGSGQQGGRQRSADRDPLGRPRATTGPDFGTTVEVPDVIDAQRARQILEEIRRRLGNALSPQIEREYLERLLDLR